MDNPIDDEMKNQHTQVNETEEKIQHIHTYMTGKEKTLIYIYIYIWLERRESMIYD
jgi:hypothetical protein